MWTPSFLHFRYIWIHKLINHKSIPEKTMTCELISEPQAASSLRDHLQVPVEDLAALHSCHWRRGASRLPMAFHRFSVALFHIIHMYLSSKHRDWDCFWMELFFCWALFTPSQIFGALGHVFKLASCCWEISIVLAMCFWEDRVTDGTDGARNYNSCGRFHQTTISVKTANFQFKKAKDLPGWKQSRDGK